MKVRYKKDNYEDYSSRFNTSTTGEIILSDTSEFISALDVWLTTLNQWKDMRQAFIDRDLIIDNYNTIFFEPLTEEDRNRGYAL